MKLTRVIAAAAVAALTVGVAGCSGGGGSANDDESGPVALQYWLWDEAQLPAYQACATAFTEENPDITVNITQLNWDDYWTKLTTGFVSGTGPDVFIDHLSQYPSFSTKGQVLDLTDLVESDSVDLTAYSPGLVDSWYGVDGGLYGLPKDWDTEGIFFNEAMVKDAGYTDSDLQNLTWNPTDGGTYEKTIAHLTVDKNGVRGDEAGFDKNNVKVYGLAAPSDAGGTSGQVLWSTFAASMADWNYLDKNPWGTNFNYTSTEFQQIIDWYFGLSKKGYMPAFGVSSTNAYAQIAAGNAATAIEGSWNSNSFATIKGVEIGIAAGPINEQSNLRGSQKNSVADSINAATKHPEAAWKFVKYMGTTACQDLVAAKAVVFPSIPSSTEKAIAAFKENGVDVSPFLLYNDASTGRTVAAPVTLAADELSDLFGDAFDNIWLGKTDASSLTPVVEQVKKLLESQ